MGLGIGILRGPVRVKNLQSKVELRVLPTHQRLAVVLLNRNFKILSIFQIFDTCSKRSNFYRELLNSDGLIHMLPSCL